MTQSSHSGPGTPRRSGKRRATHGRAADLQARRSTLGYRDVQAGPPPQAHTEPTPPNDHSARLRRRRMRALGKELRPRSLQMWLVLVVMALVSAGALRKMYVVHADYRWLQAQVNAKEEQLAALEAQNQVAQRRLAVLTSDKGREQLLIEHGYGPPGSRILLFPPDPEQRRAAEIPKNDLSPRPPSADEDARGSVLQQAGKAVGDWWRGVAGPTTVRAQQ